MTLVQKKAKCKICAVECSQRFPSQYRLVLIYLFVNLLHYSLLVNIYLFTPGYMNDLLSP